MNIRKPLQLFKFITIITLIITPCIVSAFAPLFIWDRWKLARVRARLISWGCSLGLKVMGVEVKVSDDVGHTSENYLVVSNHLSYIDIMILAGQRPSNFVTSVEIKKTPVLGDACRLMGCLFVERRNRDNLINEISEITEALKNGINVTIFPEATSTDGSSVLRFRRPLYNSALMSQRPTLPICLNYESIDGVKLSTANRDEVFWYGDMPFFSHLWNVLSHKEIIVRVDVIDPLLPEPKFEAADLAERSCEKVRERFVPCPV